MAYKSLCTFLTSDADVVAQLDSAASLAARFDAHLEVCCLGIDSTQSVGFYAGAPAIIYQDALDSAQAHAEALAQTTRKHLHGASIRWGVDTAVLTLGGINSFVGLKARFSDLVILPRPYGENRGPQDEVTTEAALFDGDSPALIIPEPGAALPEFKKIVLAWNQSDEALHAARAALPLLKNADLVNVVIIDPPTHGIERSDPGGLLTQMLARHGVRVEVSVIARTLPRISDILRRHATDQDADLLVIGAYSHSRLRQAILGGTTRNLLEETSLPVFMAR
ncbi:universal stress protein [Roseinatronobacter bogoriensis]|uniref:Universal stress protein n=1 Tax=Roseinatronobacter bogoriensis subsp. barguzinensis TaxID=441209 RepID=A0A2K8K889_9RHOB|nr:MULTISPECIES: universal stress protein [Rhodobaca]ATX65146.1 universal stress protein [Rhodobaca barguzinensis]MBB4209640.1 nucleotide-binding universal stress UspA family protein [Rhodobaca bogoriensis DSM 18756]TDW35369.1 universal stress protein family protein [Rhodobaca barguzinensis]TDY66579.1 universal stress protein family protein [Rhodobaca bogoriensis DSM 18756]